MGYPAYYRGEVGVDVVDMYHIGLEVEQDFTKRDGDVAQSYKTSEGLYFLRE